MNNVLFIAYHFPPIGGAPVQRTISFLRYLINEGYRAIVITGPGDTYQINTPQDQEQLKEIPTQISVYRVETNEPQDRKGISRKLQRILMLPRPFAKWWISSAIQAGQKAFIENSAKLIYATMSPFESADVASSLSSELGIPWVADLRDAWALDEIQDYPSRLHKKFVLMRMHKLLSTASVIIMNTPEATACLKKTFPDLAKKQIMTITNGFNSPDFQETTLPRNGNKFRIIHVGHFLTDAVKKKQLPAILGGVTAGVDVSTRSPIYLFMAIEEYLRINPIFLKKLEVIFVGNMSVSEKKIIESSRISNVCQLTGFMPRKDALKIVRTADLIFLPMHNLPIGKRSTSIPSKLYESMASGRPILAAVPDGDAKEFLTECGTAYISRPDDCDGMVRNIKEVFESWGKGTELKKVNRDFLSRFERKYLTKLLAQEFNKVLK